MSVRLILLAALLQASGLAVAEPPRVQDFRISYRVAPDQVAQEAMRGVQRAASLQAPTGESLTHRRTLKDGTHEMRAAHVMTRAQAWAMAEKLHRDNPEVAWVEPVDPDAALVAGRKPAGAGGQP